MKAHYDSTDFYSAKITEIQWGKWKFGIKLQVDNVTSFGLDRPTNPISVNVHVQHFLS